MGAALLWLAVVPPVAADDLTTLSGVTYRQVRVERVEPDGIIWRHATGQCKVDFIDLPEPVRRAYHYDPRRAAAYQAAQAQAQQQAVDQAQRNQRETADRQARLLQRRAAGLEEADNVPGQFVYHRHVAEATEALGEQIAAKQREQDLLTKDDGTVWDRHLWAIPCLIAGGGYSPGVAFVPGTDFNAHEYKAGLHHAIGGFAPDSSHDNFFKPDYLTKAYYQDVERAEAFARGGP